MDHGALEVRGLLTEVDDFTGAAHQGHRLDCRGERRVAVATEPATEMWGSEAMLLSAQPACCRKLASSPYRIRAGTVTVWASVSRTGSPGNSPSEINSVASATSLKECRVPKACIDPPPDTNACSSPTVRGRWIVSALYRYVPLQFCSGCSTMSVMK